MMEIEDKRNHMGAALGLVSQTGRRKVRWLETPPLARLAVLLVGRRRNGKILDGLVVGGVSHQQLIPLAVRIGKRKQGGKWNEAGRVCSAERTLCRVRLQRATACERSYYAASHLSHPIIVFQSLLESQASKSTRKDVPEISP